MMNTDLTTKKDIDELIIRVLSDQAKPDDCKLLYQWVKRSDENKHYFLRARNSWLSTAQMATPDRAGTLKALDAVNRKITSSPAGKEAGSGIKLLPTGEISPLKYLKAAALWILLFGLGAVFAMLFLKPARMLNLNSPVSVSAPRGSKAITALPDGTVAWLNAGSRIEYRIHDDKPTREVTLEGEAYFKVARDPDHPFTVSAGDMIVKAYGTVFNVKAYPDEKVVAATLVEGSVSVEIRNRPTNRTFLKPDEQAVYYMPDANRSENFLVTKGIDPDLYTMWINDRLQIKGETLGDLSVMLERKYDVTVRFRDESLREMRFTGIIENETIEQVMELLKISSKIEYSIDGREIWLSRAKNK